MISYYWSDGLECGLYLKVSVVVFPEIHDLSRTIQEVCRDHLQRRISVPVHINCENCDSGYLSLG